MQQVHVMKVSPDFFDTMQMPLRAGRHFGAADTPDSSKTLIINDALAKKIFPKGGAIGRRAGSTAEKNTESEIIGVVGDAKYASLREPAPPTIYRSFLQSQPGAMSVVLRSAVDPNTRIDAVRAAVKKVDPNLPIAAVATQAEQIERRFAQEKLFAMAYSWFGGLALVIAAVGLFGLMSYSVSRRTNEIGVRMALGADRGVVSRMVLRESMQLVAIGVRPRRHRRVCRQLAGRAHALRRTAARCHDDGHGDCRDDDGRHESPLYLPARRASRVDP